MEELLPEYYKCSQTDCSIQATGRCVNGLNIDECPNKIKIVKDSEELSVSVDSSSSQTIRLPWGEGFKENELPFLTNKYPCKSIIAIGEPSSGKSTLYAALLDSFHKGGCGNYIFNSTRTPIGFERMCHLAREKSKGRHPKTERTKSHEFTYLHLSVRDRKLENPPVHLIFADVNGERFQNAKDRDDELIKLSILRRVDHIFFMADGGLMIDNGEKHVVKSDVWQIIKRCIKNNMFGENQTVSLVITKWDEINAAGKSSDVTNFFIDPTKTEFGSLIKNVIKVASRSMNDEVPPRSGLDEILEICVSNKIKQVCPYIPELNREFKKFKYR